MKRSMRASVEEKISACRKWFRQLDEQERTRRITDAGEKVETLTSKYSDVAKVECPACGSPGMARGEVSSYGKPKIRNNQVRVEGRVLPNEFRCGCCRLHLSGYGELNHAGVGNIFVAETYEDPVEFFSIDVEERMREYAADDYGND